MLEKSYSTLPDGKMLVWICVRKYSHQAYLSDNNIEGVTEVSFQMKSLGGGFKVQSEYPCVMDLVLAKCQHTHWNIFADVSFVR